MGLSRTIAEAGLEALASGAILEVAAVSSGRRDLGCEVSTVAADSKLDAANTQLGLSQLTGAA